MKANKIYNYLFFLFSVLFLNNNLLFTQTKKIDSLKSVLLTKQDDISLVNNLNLISSHLLSIGRYDTSLLFAERARSFSEKIKYLKGIAISYSNIGKIKADKGDYFESLSNHFKALSLYEKLKDKNGLASTYNNLGAVYWFEGSYNDALKCFNLALKISKELNDKKGIANSISGIGLVNFSQRKYNDALENHFNSLKINEELGDKSQIAKNYNNIGRTYNELGNHNEALKNHFISLKIKENINDNRGIAYSYIGIGKSYKGLNKLLDSRNYYLQGLEISKKIGYKMLIRDCYKGLVELDSLGKNFQHAFIEYQLFIKYKDSLVDEENAKKLIQIQLKHEYDKKEVEVKAISKVEKEKIEAIAKAEKEKQQLVTYSVLVGLILVIVFAGFIFNRFRISNKQNKLITEQKSALEHQKQEITDSINYSKRIQTAILPDINEIQQNLIDFFILYQPKDIVSGDFYYFKKVNNDLFIAAADCTGHGVPGAFMSLVGSKELKIANGLTNSPAKILMHLNNGVKDTLRQNHIDGTKDGMDIALVRINETTVTYSAANRPLWILKKGTSVIEEIKATKTAIAGFTEDNFEFAEHTINLSKGDTIYLFSDGYADQFGGNKQKKMTTKRFREFVLSIKDKSMTEQQTELEDYFNTWQGDTEQVDDLLVIGIKL